MMTMIMIFSYYPFKICICVFSLFHGQPSQRLISKNQLSRHECYWYRVSFGGNENVLKLNIGDGCATVNILKTTELFMLKG